MAIKMEKFSERKTTATEYYTVKVGMMNIDRRNRSHVEDSVTARPQTAAERVLSFEKKLE